MLVAIKAPSSFLAIGHRRENFSEVQDLTTWRQLVQDLGRILTVLLGQESSLLNAIAVHHALERPLAVRGLPEAPHDHGIQLRELGSGEQHGRSCQAQAKVGARARLAQVVAVGGEVEHVVDELKGDAQVLAEREGHVDQVRMSGGIRQRWVIAI